MAAVAFSIGSRPGVDKYEALELAELLERRRSIAASRLASRIRAQADRDPDRETSTDIELDPDETAELAALLDEPRWPEERPAFAHLRDELRRHRDTQPAP